MKVDTEQLNKIIDERISRAICNWTIYSTPNDRNNSQLIQQLFIEVKKLKEEIKFIKNSKLKGYKKELEDNDFKVEIK